MYINQCVRTKISEGKFQNRTIFITSTKRETHTHRKSKKKKRKRKTTNRDINICQEKIISFCFCFVFSLVQSYLFDLKAQMDNMIYNCRNIKVKNITYSLIKHTRGSLYDCDKSYSWKHSIKIIHCVDG